MRELTATDLVYLVLAVRWTLLLSILSFLGGGALGFIVALMRVSPICWLRWMAIAYIRIFQSTPVLLQLFVVYFCIPLIGVSLDPYTAAIFALSLNSSGFFGEIWRGAIQSVSKGQWEAARALGLHYLRCMRHVVLPQALRAALAPTAGFTVNLIKSTSVASIIGFIELTRSGALLNNATFDPFPVFGMVSLIYFILCWPISLASRKLERRLARPYQS